MSNRSSASVATLDDILEAARGTRPSDRRHLHELLGSRYGVAYTIVLDRADRLAREYRDDMFVKVNPSTLIERERWRERRLATGDLVGPFWLDQTAIHVYAGKDRGHWARATAGQPTVYVARGRARRDPSERPPGHLPTPDVRKRGRKQTYGAWFLTDGTLILARQRGSDRLVPLPRRGIPRGAMSFGSKDEAEGELGFLDRQGFYPLWTPDAKARYITWR